MVKNLPATKETQVQSLGWEDPLAKGSVFLPGELHGQRLITVDLSIHFLIHFNVELF